MAQVKFSYTMNDSSIVDGIKSVGKSAKRLQENLHKLNVSILNRWSETGDVRPVIKHANALIQALDGSSLRVNAIRDWFAGWAGFEWKEDAFHPTKTTISADDVLKAKKEPFWTYSPEPKYKPLDLVKLLKSLDKRAKKRREEGLTDEDNVPSELLDQLDEILSNYTA